MAQPGPHAADELFPTSPGGFCFENYRRNQGLLSSDKFKFKVPQARKTGTTICGAVFSGGVVLGADTRSTSNLVVEKDCEKIHYIAPNIYCCGAGTAADTEFTTAQVASQLELLRLNSGRQSRVASALTMLKRHLFNYQGHVSAALILGGVDALGPHIYTVYPHGSTDRLPYITMGSGSLAAMSVMETKFKDGMSRQECIELVELSIKAGVFNDLGSGSNINYTIITRDGVETFKSSDKPEGLDKIAKDVFDENAKEKITARINAPKYFAEFPTGTSVVVGEPMVEAIS